MTKALKKTYSPIPVLQDNNITTITDKEKANLLAAQFKKAHSIDLIQNTYEQEQIMEDVTDFLWENEERTEEWKSLITSPGEVREVIKKLPSMKALGSDQMQNIVLKAVLKLRYFPQQWKLALVISIPESKPGFLKIFPA
uniref:uncharacterized protein LOC117603293 n=1 Tax=Osmia lignaria TaxID=473952 RepID=UPI001479135E|nr:uncharacterized protein LOC117603293 [Osmia lignaria]